MQTFVTFEVLLCLKYKHDIKTFNFLQKVSHFCKHKKESPLHASKALQIVAVWKQYLYNCHQTKLLLSRIKNSFHYRFR